MALPLRIEFPGAFYNMMNRGNTGMNIYRSEQNREKFLEYISGAGIAARHDQIAKKFETDLKVKGREDRIRRKILNI